MSICDTSLVKPKLKVRVALNVPLTTYFSPNSLACFSTLVKLMVHCRFSLSAFSAGGVRFAVGGFGAVRLLSQGGYGGAEPDGRGGS